MVVTFQTSNPTPEESRWLEANGWRESYKDGRFNYPNAKMDRKLFPSEKHTVTIENDDRIAVAVFGPATKKKEESMTTTVSLEPSVDDDYIWGEEEDVVETLDDNPSLVLYVKQNIVTDWQALPDIVGKNIFSEYVKKYPELEFDFSTKTTSGKLGKNGANVQLVKIRVRHLG